VIDPLADTPTCEERTERDVTAEEVESGCRDENFLVAPPPTTAPVCQVLYWNNRVWGYVAESASPHEAGAGAGCA
jgi:hypothetical protein